MRLSADRGMAIVAVSAASANRGMLGRTAPSAAHMKTGARRRPSSTRGIVAYGVCGLSSSESWSFGGVVVVLSVVVVVSLVPLS